MPCGIEASTDKCSSANKWNRRIAMTGCKIEVVLMCQILVEVSSVSC